MEGVSQLRSSRTRADTTVFWSYGVETLPTIRHREPATGRFINAEAFARVSAPTTPEGVVEPVTGNKKVDKEQTKTSKNKKRITKSRKKKSAKKKNKKKD